MKKQFFSSKRPSIAAAIDILGREKVITSQCSSGYPQESFSKEAVVIRNSEKQLVEARKENDEGKSNWIFVPIMGYSFLDLFAEYCNAPSEETDAYFNPHSTYIFSSESRSVTLKNYVSGYRLCDFFGRFWTDDWFDQERYILKLGAEYERVDLAILTEAAFNIYNETGKFLPARGGEYVGREPFLDGYLSGGWSDDEKKNCWEIYFEQPLAIGTSVIIVKKFIF